MPTSRRNTPAAERGLRSLQSEQVLASELSAKLGAERGNLDADLRALRLQTKGLSRTVGSWADDAACADNKCAELARLDSDILTIPSVNVKN